MKATQIKYARERLNDLAATRKNAIIAKHTTTPFEFSGALMAAALKAGEFKIVPAKDRKQHPYYIRDIISFPGEVTRSYNEDAAKPELAKLDAEVTSIMDTLVLGDTDSALEAIKAFEAKA